jgi:NAD(P)-dependent dehydrogenase (short-subunit alcohol dehydrogenase family)
MKIAVTGHKSGIGKAIYTLLSQTHTVIGFDLDTVNIEIPADRKSIIEQSKDCDIFINNAYARSYQLSMFDDILLDWKDKDSKYIINVGSIMQYKVNTGSQTEDAVLFPPQYINSKKTLRKKTISNSLNSEIKCKVSIIHPGFTRTQMIADMGISEPQLEPVDVALQVKQIIESNLHFLEITFSK